MKMGFSTCGNVRCRSGLSPRRLERLARRTGRTKTFYAREAILEHLEELEDLYLAERALERIHTGEERAIPLRDVMKRHGLER